MNTKRVKKVIAELNKIEWSENLDSIYLVLTELDYLIYKYRYKVKHEYIDKIIYNIEKFVIESDYSNKRNIFYLIKAFCNILNRYIL